MSLRDDAAIAYLAWLRDKRTHRVSKIERETKEAVLAASRDGLTSITLRGNTRDTVTILESFALREGLRVATCQDGPNGETFNVTVSGWS